MKKNTCWGSISKEIEKNGMTIIYTYACHQMKLLRDYADAKVSSTF
jgi:hypothetical protein